MKFSAIQMEPFYTFPPIDLFSRVQMKQIEKTIVVRTARRCIE